MRRCWRRKRGGVAQIMYASASRGRIDEMSQRRRNLSRQSRASAAYSLVAGRGALAWRESRVEANVAQPGIGFVACGVMAERRERRRQSSLMTIQRQTARRRFCWQS